MSSLRLHSDISAITPYVPGKSIAEVSRELGIPEDQIIKLASNENPLGPSKKAIQALANCKHLVHFYPGDREFDLKERLAEYSGVPKDHLIIGNGSSEIICLLANAFGHGGAPVVLSQPSFIMYRLATQYAGGTRFEVPLTPDFKHDIPALIQKVNDTKAHILFLDNPINPLGSILSKAEIDHVVQEIPSSTLIVFDEAYHEYAKVFPEYSDTMQYLKEGRENVCFIRTFSKVFGLAGLRLGYLIAHPKVVSYTEHVHAPFSVSLPAMEAAYSALEDTEHLEKTVTLNAESLTYFQQECDSMGLKYVHPYGNFICIEIPKLGKDVFVAMQKKGVIIRPLGAYNLPHAIRISTGTMEQNKHCMQALKEVLAAA